VGAVGVEISLLPLKRHNAYTTACCYDATAQAVIHLSSIVFVSFCGSPLSQFAAVEICEIVTKRRVYKFSGSGVKLGGSRGISAPPPQIWDPPHLLSDPPPLDVRSPISTSSSVMEATGTKSLPRLLMKEASGVSPLLLATQKPTDW